MLLILPFGLIYLSGLPEWLSRTVTYCFFFGVTNVGVLWWSLNPQTVIVGNDGKLALAGNEKKRRKFELTARIMGASFSVFCFLHMTLPLSHDVYALLQGKTPIEVAGVVANNDTPYEAWYLSQSITLQAKPASFSYGMLFSLEPRINIGENVELLVLPRSHRIVQRLK